MVDGLGHALASWFLPANAWTAVLLAGALLLDRALARRARASLRIALYAPVALRVLVPFSWAVAVPNLPRVAMLMPADLVTSAEAAGASPASSWGVLAGVYVLVAVLLALATVLRRRRLARAVASASTPVDALAPCPVVAHPELGPMVVGVLSPRIVLPRALLASESREALACVLRHESAHVRRGDPWLSLGIDALLVACWPVAPLWIAATRVRHLVELACDEAALAGFDEPARRRYGHVLLDLAEEGSLGLAGAGSLHFGSRLRARIEAIALERPWPLAVQAALVVSAVAGFAACSSTAPAPSRGSSPIAKQDEYGYRFENDRFDHGTPAERAAASPPAAPEAAGEHGRLAPEAIQAVVRQSFGRFRSCYEKALPRNKTLAGTVTVSFVINPDGSVRDASDNASTLPDPHVVQCVVEGFGRLTYPPPQGGYVTVVYPVVFSPGD